MLMVPKTNQSILINYLLVVIFLLVVVYPFLDASFLNVWDYVGGDFTIFYQASHDLLEGQNPYPEALFEGTVQENLGKAWGNYIYPPFYARILMPLAYLPIFWAKKTYLFLCLIGYLYFLYPRRSDCQTCWEQWFLIAILLGWGPAILTFRIGQSNFLPLFLIHLAIQVSRDFNRYQSWGREWLAGMLIGVASAVKLTPALMGGAFFSTLRWRGILGIGLGMLLAFVLTGPFLTVTYFLKVLPTMSDTPAMRRWPGLHLLGVQIAERLGITDPTSIDRLTHLGVVLSGMTFLAVLVFLFLKRGNLYLPDLLLIACYFPPIWMGENPDHYLLNLLPVLVVGKKLIRRAIAQYDPAKYGAGLLNWTSFQFLAFVVFQIPSMNYWFFCKELIDWLTAISGLHYSFFFISSSFLSFLLVAWFLTRNQSIDSTD